MKFSLICMKNTEKVFFEKSDHEIMHLINLEVAVIAGDNSVRYLDTSMQEIYTSLLKSRNRRGFYMRP